MRLLILNMDYPAFLAWLYSEHPALESRTYNEQMQARMESLYGIADFYSGNLRKLGHEAYDIHPNNEPMQKTWAREHGVKIRESAPAAQSGRSFLQNVRRLAAGTMLRRLKPLFRPLLTRIDKPPAWFYDILAAQIEHYKPDVLLNQVIYSISGAFLREIKPGIRLLVGQHAASPLPEARDYSCYDLIISSFPPTLDYFRRRGVPVAPLRLGFEPRVLSFLEPGDPPEELTFIGSLSSVHGSRTDWLEEQPDRLAGRALG